MPGPQVHFGDIHGKDEARAGIDIKGRAFCSDSAGDDAGSGRSDMVTLDGGTYDEIQLLGEMPASSRGALGGGNGQRIESFRGNNLPGLDAGAGGDPFVAGI